MKSAYLSFLCCNSFSSHSFFTLILSLVLERSQSVFEGFLSAGTASKSWFAIFSLLQRLRQACDHVSLTVNRKLETSDTVRLKDKSEKEASSSNISDDGEDAVNDDVSIDKFTALHGTFSIAPTNCT